MTEDEQNSIQKAMEHLSGRIDRQNELLDLYIRNQTSVKARVTAGLWTGLGTVLGATVLVSILILALKPLSRIDWISPIVDRVIDSLENRNGPRGNRTERTERTDRNEKSGQSTPKSF